MFSPSKRSDVEPFHAMDVLAEATRRRQAGHSVISLAVGQPSHPAPEAALQAARVALSHGRIGYTDALGRLALKRALAEHYRCRHGLEIDPGRIAITTGSSAGFNLAFLTLFDPGDWFLSLWNVPFGSRVAVVHSNASFVEAMTSLLEVTNASIG